MYSYHFTLATWSWAKSSRERRPRWQKDCNKIRMMFFYLVLYWELREYERVSRTPAPCPPHGYHEGQTTLTLHRIARSTAPQFADWSKIEIKDRDVYRFTLVLPDRTRLYSNWARLAPAYGRAECICISNLYVATCGIILSPSWLPLYGLFHSSPRNAALEAKFIYVLDSE